MAVILTRTGALALGVSATAAFAAVLVPHLLADVRDAPAAVAKVAKVARAPAPPSVELGVPQDGIVVDVDGIHYRGQRNLREADLRGALEPLARAGKRDRMSSHWAVPLLHREGGSLATAGAAIGAAFAAGFERVIVRAEDGVVCHVDRAPTADEITKATSIEHLCVTGLGTLPL